MLSPSFYWVNFLLLRIHFSVVKLFVQMFSISYFSSFVIIIGFLWNKLSSISFDIQFLWFLGHSGIFDNEMTDPLAKSTVSYRCPFFYSIPCSTFFPFLKMNVNDLWLNKWNNLSPHFATCYRPLSPTILQFPYFHTVNLIRKSISAFPHLRFGHTLILSHFLKVSLNDSSLWKQYNFPTACDSLQILYNCSSLDHQSKHHFAFLHFLHTQPNLFRF